MKLILQVIVIIIVLALFSCSNSTKSLNENKIFHIDIDKCELSIDLKLSDLIDSCWLVRLETTIESMLGNYLNHVFIKNEYLLIDDGAGIYKFSADGKFIKKLINIGRGPDELSQVRMLYYYEEKDLLFIDDYFKNKNYLLCYDIISESFIPPVKKCFSDRWGDFIIYRDSLIIGSLSPYEAVSNPYAIFIQDFKGNYISSIQSKRKFIHLQNQNEAFQKMFIYTGDKFIHVKYFLDDTIFTLKNNQLLPYLISNYNSVQIEPPHMLPEIGDKKSVFKEFENTSFLIFRNQTYLGTVQLGFGNKADYKNVYFFLDKTNSNYGIIKSYTDDFIGHVQEGSGNELILPSLLPNNKLYVVYNPIDLISKEFGDQDKQELPANIYKQFHSIQKKLNETDNPILLIGTIKKVKRITDSKF